MNKFLNPSPLDLSRKIVDIASENNANDVVLIDVRPQVYYTDYLVVFSLDTDRQINSVIREIELQFKTTGIIKEGIPEHGWVIIDFFDVIVHIFKPEIRETYQLEHFFEFGSELVRLI
ncbi:MAG: ribosome silencing factor [SAR202 cluster bacterium]|nr:ribosome silencing factor [SAR202 cluster bacterium]|tara:strand:- start:60689 stop:61042 length:354 start_codon:yes stop_codon:yes gene_type:complete